MKRETDRKTFASTELVSLDPSADTQAASNLISLLPYETLQVILEDLSKEQLLLLRLVSRRLCQLATCVLFEKYSGDKTIINFGFKLLQLWASDTNFMPELLPPEHSIKRIAGAAATKDRSLSLIYAEWSVARLNNREAEASVHLADFYLGLLETFIQSTGPKDQQELDADHTVLDLIATLATLWPTLQLNSAITKRADQFANNMVEKGLPENAMKRSVFIQALGLFSLHRDTIPEEWVTTVLPPRPRGHHYENKIYEVQLRALLAFSKKTKLNNFDIFKRIRNTLKKDYYKDQLSDNLLLEFFGQYQEIPGEWRTLLLVDSDDYACFLLTPLANLRIFTFLAPTMKRIPEEWVEIALNYIKKCREETRLVAGLKALAAFTESYESIPETWANVIYSVCNSSIVNDGYVRRVTLNALRCIEDKCTGARDAILSSEPPILLSIPSAFPYTALFYLESLLIASHGASELPPKHEKKVLYILKGRSSTNLCKVAVAVLAAYSSSYKTVPDAWVSALGTATKKPRSRQHPHWESQETIPRETVDIDQVTISVYEAFGHFIGRCSEDASAKIYAAVSSTLATFYMNERSESNFSRKQLPSFDSFLTHCGKFPHIWIRLAAKNLQHEFFSKEWTSTTLLRAGAGMLDEPGRELLIAEILPQLVRTDDGYVNLAAVQILVAASRQFTQDQEDRVFNAVTSTLRETLLTRGIPLKEMQSTAEMAKSFQHNPQRVVDLIYELGNPASLGHSHYGRRVSCAYATQVLYNLRRSGYSPIPPIPLEWATPILSTIRTNDRKARLDARDRISAFVHLCEKLTVSTMDTMLLELKEHGNLDNLVIELRGLYAKRLGNIPKHWVADTLEAIKNPELQISSISTLRMFSAKMSYIPREWVDSVCNTLNTDEYSPRYTALPEFNAFFPHLSPEQAEQMLSSHWVAYASVGHPEARQGLLDMLSRYAHKLSVPSISKKMDFVLESLSEEQHVNTKLKALDALAAFPKDIYLEYLERIIEVVVTASLSRAHSIAGLLEQKISSGVLKTLSSYPEAQNQARGLLLDQLAQTSPENIWRSNVITKMLWVLGPERPPRKETQAPAEAEQGEERAQADLMQSIALQIYNTLSDLKIVNQRPYEEPSSIVEIDTQTEPVAPVPRGAKTLLSVVSD